MLVTKVFTEARAERFEKYFLISGPIMFNDGTSTFSNVISLETSVYDMIISLQ